MSMTDERGDKPRLSRRSSGIQEREKPASSDKPSDRRKSAAGKKQRPKGVHLTLWLLRKSIVPIIMLIMLLAGLYVGYTVLGKQPGGDVFKWSTWQHLYDLVYSDS